MRIDKVKMWNIWDIIRTVLGSSLIAFIISNIIKKMLDINIFSDDTIILIMLFCLSIGFVIFTFLDNLINEILKMDFGDIKMICPKCNKEHNKYGMVLCTCGSVRCELCGRWFYKGNKVKLKE